VGFAALVLTASLLGSVHCAAMCGAFVCFYAGADPDAAARRDILAHVAYNLGRLVSYLALGVLAGYLGQTLDRAGTLAGIARMAALVSGVLMVGWGVHAVLLARGVRIGAIAAPSWWQRAMGSTLERVRTQSPPARAAITGLVTTLLPCGWLYAFVVTAAGTGTPARSVLVMLFFWAGTLPMMLAVGVGARRFFGPLRAKLPIVSAALIVVLGLFTIASRLDLLPGLDWTHRLTPTVPMAEGSVPPPAHAH
jgi:sulfite exporter TauE/SafE